MKDSETRDLKEVLGRAQKGDSEAFSYIYEHYYTPIYRYLYFRLRGNREDAEDLTQDVFIKIYNSFNTYIISDSNPLPYFYTIARNTLIDRSRKKKLDMVSLGEDETVLENARDESDSAEESFAKGEDAANLHMKIAELPPEQQDVITLRFISELSTKEVSTVLNKTEEAVRQLQSRGLKSLRTIFNKGHE